MLLGKDTPKMYLAQRKGITSCYRAEVKAVRVLVCKDANISFCYTSALATSGVACNPQAGYRLRTAVVYSRWEDRSIANCHTCTTQLSLYIHCIYKLEQAILPCLPPGPHILSI